MRVRVRGRVQVRRGGEVMGFKFGVGGEDRGFKFGVGVYGGECGSVGGSE